MTTSVPVGSVQPHIPAELRGFIGRFALRRFEDTSGSAWTYRDTLGNGAAVVFLPGAAGGGDVAFRLVEGLEDSYRCICVTYPGGLTPEKLALGLLELLEHLGLDRVAIWGSSYGAWWSQEFARCHPERVSALWIGNAVFDGSDVAHLALFDVNWLEASTAHTIQSAWLQAVMRQPDSELRSLQLYFIGQSLPEDNLKGRLLQVVRATALPPALQVARTVVSDCINDPVIGPAARDRMVARYPDVIHLRLEEGGHYPHLTNLAVMLPAVRRWLGEP